MKAPLVSIGVPSFNRPKTLERTLDCLIKQSYRNLEIVISDDCSTDPEVEIVINKFITDTRVRYYRQPINKGAIYNFNFLLDKLSGEYFMRIADDDWMDHDYIEKCLVFLLNNPDYSSAYGLAKVYDPNGEFNMFDVEVKLDHTLPKERILYYYSNVRFNSCYYGIMHRSLLPLVRSRNIIAMDWLIVARIAFVGKIKLIENIFTHIAMGGDSRSLEHLTQAYKMSDFTKAFPHLNIGLNAAKDILWSKNVYKKTSFLYRITLALECLRVLNIKFNIKSEIKPGVKRYTKIIKSKFNG